MEDNRSPLGLLTVPNPGGSSFSPADGRKPAKTIDEMMDILRERGLIITDGQRLRTMLLDDNYYRLSGYFRAFQKDPAGGDDRFVPGTCDEDFLIPYSLDTRLRGLLLDGISRLEVTIRSRFAYYVAVHGGAYSYLEPGSYVEKKNRHGQMLRDGLVRDISWWLSQSSEVCIRHYRDQRRDIPIWAVVETLPFGVISKMISLYRDTAVLQELYKSLGLNAGNARNAQILHAIVYLRNLCSHHSRLWNREMVVSPTVTNRMKERFPDFRYKNKSVASIVVVVMFLMEAVTGDDSYTRRMTAFLEEDTAYAQGIRRPLIWR